MLNWLSKMLGGERAAGATDVPKAWIDAIVALLDSVEDRTKSGGRPGLVRDILDYVQDGNSIEILSDVGQREGVAQKLGLTGHSYGSQVTPAAKLYGNFDTIPIAAMLRWARLLDASIAQVHNAHYLPLPPGNQWPETLLMHSAGWNLNTWQNNRLKARHLSWPGMARLLLEAGIEPTVLLVAAFTVKVDQGYGIDHRALLVTDLAGYSDVIDQLSETVRPLLSPGTAPQKLHVINMLSPLSNEVLGKFASEVVELATSGSKQVRAAAEPLVTRCGAAAVEPLKSMATAGKPDQRLLALKQLWLFAGSKDDEALKSFVKATASADKAPSVQALPQEWEAVAAVHAAADEQDKEFEMPQIHWDGLLTPQLSARLEALWIEINQGIERANKQLSDAYAHAQAAAPPRHALHQHPLLKPAELQVLKDYIASPEPRFTASRPNARQLNWQVALPALKKLAAEDTATPMAMLKMLAYFDLFADNDRSISGGVTQTINAMHAHRRRPTLLELSVMLEAMGAPTIALFNSYCSQWGGSIARDWDDEAVWPFFAHRLETLIQYFGRSHNHDYWFDRSSLFRAVAAFPTPPVQVVNAIFDLALGTGRTDRPLAQAALASMPGKEVRIIQALTDGKAEVRTVAAQWLGRLKHREAIPALEAAVKKEKHDVPKGAMLDALQAMGQPVEKYLDRKALLTEATKSLAKGLPKDLEWFPWAAAPTIRWADSGEPVPTDALKWLLVQSVKQKTPEPNAVLRKYCSMFDARDREALGQFVLETWIAEDVRPITPEQAQASAKSHAQSTHAFMQRSPQYFQNDPKLGWSEEQLFAAYLPSFMKQPAGSAIASKGLLAVASACAGQRAAGTAGRYLKEFYGTRAAHGKALIAMLAWIEHPSATQLMLSVGSRFRTKSFQEEATRQAEALAERKGWTLAELADRTMPSAGFDETGTMELSYGERRFSARLMPDFKVELFNPDGKQIAALPEPRQDDNADAAKDAKKAFSAAKKEIKSIVEMQTSRLYEALCTERDWAFDDWNRYLNQHAVVRRLVQRLVWCVTDEGKVLSTFRPLDDGTLTDADDNAVELAADARVRIAHDSNLPAELVAQWQQHLIDYKVTPLFQQFGKGTYALPDAKKKEQEITDFEGHVIEAFSLRGRALKLGYTRGPAEDGGWFHVYEKRFPTLGLVAVLQFTGNPLPEENRTVALLKLSFESSQAGSSQQSTLALSNVPKVLLSECYNDVRLIAASGSGHDPDWRKKTEY